MMEPIAHAKEKPGKGFETHKLEEHLFSVAKLASSFAEKFHSAEWGYLAGLWHDLGKYSSNFQNKIRLATGYDSEAIIENNFGQVKHSTAGAIWACEQFKEAGKILAFIIAGHHAGLPDWQNENGGLGDLAKRLQSRVELEAALSNSPPTEILKQNLPSPAPARGKDPAMWIRLLFSCLVDADFLDTEKFMDPEKSAIRANYPSLSKLKEYLDSYLERKIKESEPIPINGYRTDILHQCRKKAVESPGLFSLTVPTGGGKTLSSLAFAFDHSLRFDKHRIIYVIPYTSIIEQTADIFREIFPTGVIEHHSNLDPEKETVKSRLASENWEAPVIVTTAVQFFESLFASKTSKTRKLHNIVNSVVILDEAQLLPPEFLSPICKAIEELGKNYGVTFVLCTATQPALGSQKGFDFKFSGLENIREIMENPIVLHEKFKRVHIEIPVDFSVNSPWDQVAEKLKSHPSVLCVVNSRKDCLDLHKLMPEGTIHLSRNMCGQHISTQVAEIRERLKRNEDVRVISTQLVECGVDIDFPVVYRALGGLDSLAQAAGRCNREGKLEKGKVVVFIPPSDPPVGHLRQGASITKQVISDNETSDPISPDRFMEFFRQFYWLKGEEGLDKHGILKDLQKENLLFRTVGEKFRIIDDLRYAPVIVKYGESPNLIRKLDHAGPSRELLRKLQRYIVNIPKHAHKRLLENGEIRESPVSGKFVQISDVLYNSQTGINLDSGNYDPNSFIG
jgi:CRISPR-associated endonuclease/helicase Cas3